jgi:hypothetical protein
MKIQACILLFFLCCMSFARSMSEKETMRSSIPHKIATNLKEISSILRENSEVPSKTLVCWDIDLTLLRVEHPVAYYENLKRYYFTLKREFTNLSSEETDEAICRFVLLNKNVLIDPTAPKFISALQRSGVINIALTAGLTGKIGEISEFEKFRHQCLADEGIHFNEELPVDMVLFSNFPQYRGNYPTYYKGVLSSNGARGPVNKGKLLIEFLKLLPKEVQTIFLVDDKSENLDEVKVALVTYRPDVKFIGIHYTEGRDLPAPVLSEDEFVKSVRVIIKEIKEGC